MKLCLILFSLSVTIFSVSLICVHDISIRGVGNHKICFRVIMYVGGTCPETEGCLPRGPRAAVLSILQASRAVVRPRIILVPMLDGKPWGSSL